MALAVLIVLQLTVTLLAVPPRHVSADLAADQAALLALRAAVGPHLPWDPTTSPCSGRWLGVSCSGTAPLERVVELRLIGKSLRGQIPGGTVGNLTALQTLSLRFNAISGSIPADIGGCAALRWVYLSGNRFDGAIPEGFFSLELLKKADLSGNRLTGAVSPGLNALRSLATLNLEGNDFAGALPSALSLPKLTQFNVSGNARLEGPVPASLAGMPASAFAGTALCGPPLATCAPVGPAPSGEDSKGGLPSGAVAGIIVAAVVVLLLVLAAWFLVCFRRRRRAATATTETAAADVHEGAGPITVTVAMADRDAVKRSHSPPPAAMAALTGEGRKLVFVGGAPEKPYDLETMLRASAEVLGKGVHGTTYRATLDGGGPVLAIKRLRDVRLPEREFREMAVALGALRHGSLPPLRAYFYSKEEKLLVSDFVGAGSLCSLLHGSGAEGRARLDFAARARIALAAARGVAFIHGSRLAHGGIKSSNVVVNAARDGAYVADYGLAQLAGSGSLPKRGAGYRAPEVTSDAAKGLSQSQGADVYGFGVVVLELLTGRAPAHALADDGAPGGGGGVDLARWVRSVLQEEWTSEVFDSAIGNEPRVEEDMMRLLRLGMDCTERSPERRPAMAEVEARIERIVEDACRRADLSSTDGSRSVSA